MGGWFCRMVLAPDVTTAEVERFAVALRDLGSEGQIHVHDLVGRAVRRPELVAARDAHVRVIELEVGSDVAIAAGEAVFGPGRFFVREEDDEFVDQRYPDPAWISRTFGREDLEFLLDPLFDPKPWNVWSRFIRPRRPDLPMDFPIDTDLFVVAVPGGPRPCPYCGLVGVSKQLARHCAGCYRGFIAFPDLTTATTIVDVIGADAFAFGRCPRCRRSQQFTLRVQQCSCGLVLRMPRAFHPDMGENEDQIRSAIDEYVERVRASQVQTADAVRPSFLRRLVRRNGRRG